MSFELKWKSFNFCSIRSTKKLGTRILIGMLRYSRSSAKLSKANIINQMPKKAKKSASLTQSSTKTQFVPIAQPAVCQPQKLEEIIEEPEQELMLLTEKQLKNKKNNERKKERKHQQWLKKQEENKQSLQLLERPKMQEKKPENKIEVKLLLEVPPRWQNIVAENQQQDNESQNEQASVLKAARLKFTNQRRRFSDVMKQELEQAKQSLSTKERTRVLLPKQLKPIVEYEEYYVNESLRNETEEQVRRILDSLYKQRFRIKREIKLNILANYQPLNERLDALNEKMEGYKQARKVKIVTKCALNHPTFVDLHNLRQEEIHPLLEAMCKMLAFQASVRSERVPFEKIQGKKYCQLTMRMGAGNRSEEPGQPALKGTLDRMEERGQIEVIERQEAAYVLRIPLPEN